MKKKVTAKVEQEDEQKFVVSGNMVTWEYKQGEIEIELDDLDRIFYEYSVHGLNMSQVQVQNRHGFTALQWQSLKRTFDLVKQSDVFSPYTLSLYSGKEQCDMIAKKMEEKYSPKNMREVIAYEDQKQKLRAFTKAVKDASKADYKQQQFQTAILDYVTACKDAPLVRRCSATKVVNAIGLVADIHFGADIMKERNLPEFNESVIIKKLKKAAEDMNSRKAKNLRVVINGDLIETFTGLNHINSWMNISKKDGFGADAVIHVSEILTDFLSAINNIKDVVILSGNHDRTSSNNKEDVAGQVAQMVSFILNARFSKKFKVTWVKDVHSFKMDGCGFVVTHGHLALSKKNPESLINNYGFPGCFNLVILSHLHTRKILADGLNHRVLHSPSIFTGNDYSKNLGFSSLAGYLYITVENKYPVVVDYPLP